MENIENKIEEPIKRGHIYKWHKDGVEDRYVLSISSDSRGLDNIISVIFFTKSSLGRDIVKIDNPLLGDAKYVKCGMLTYVKRNDLSKYSYGEVSGRTMSLIDRQICLQLDVSSRDMEIELEFYKRKYDELMERVIGKLDD